MEGGTSLRILAVYPPGLERLGQAELAALGIKGRALAGGVEFRGDLKTLYLVNLASRLANRLLVRVADFRARSLKEYEDRISRYPWELYIPEGDGVKIRVTSLRSALYHEGAVAERTLRGICRRLKRSVSPGSGQTVVVRIERSHCLVSLDSSGGLLCQRGWRLAKGPAPLRENLAAALILLSGWQTQTPLVDPFCGAGTIAIEAALMALGRPPGERRSFAFERWKNFSPQLWQKVKELFRPQGLAPKTKIIAGDHDPKALAAARDNASRAKVADRITFVQTDFSRIHLPGRPGAIVTNPPYGRLVHPAENLKSLYHRFGSWLKRKAPGWSVTLLSPWQELGGIMGISLEPTANFPHGGQRVWVLKGIIASREI